MLTCFPTENTAARMPVHIIFLFFTIFIFVLLLSMQHNTFHHMTFDQMDIIIIICSLLQSKTKRKLLLPEKADCHQCLCNRLREAANRDSRSGQSENGIRAQHLNAFLSIRSQYFKIIYFFRLILYAYYAFLEYSSPLVPKLLTRVCQHYHTLFRRREMFPKRSHTQQVTRTFRYQAREEGSDTKNITCQSTIK